VPENAEMRAGLHHFGMELKSAADVEAAAAALAARGVAVTRNDANGIFVRDPDGQLVEFAAR
jgi:catechol 2,3-dioxygenase-like lactoylglutathione lyase family enzyme